MTARQGQTEEQAPTFAVDRKTFYRILKEARAYWPHICVVFLLDLVAIPLALLEPLPLKIAIDSVVGEEPVPAFLQRWLPGGVIVSPLNVLLFAAALMVGVQVFSAVYGVGVSYLRASTAEKMTLRLRAKMFRHVQRMSLSYHDAKGSSDSIYRIQYDAPAIEWVALDGVLPYVTQIVKLGTVFVVAANISLELALVAVAVAPFIFWSARFYRPRLRGRWRDVKRLESNALSIIQEVLSSLRVVKAFGGEEREERRFSTETRVGIRARLHVLLVGGTFGMLAGLITTIGRAAVLFLGARQVLRGTLTPGNLLLVMSYLGQIYAPIRSLGQRGPKLANSLTSAERVVELLDEPTDVPEHPNPRPLARAKGVIEYQGVSFAYNSAELVLRDVSFQVPAGARVGIVGKTGSGKSTLMSLLMRFYDPTTGRILLDGVDTREYRLVDLRDQFAIVLQDAVLFATTIRENIAYSRPEATEDDIIRAATAANAHDFIVDLPRGYDTPVGERGMLLSGGERQRIALARAFLKDAPILVLDEPTSSVDTKTEGLIIDAMERLMRGRTTFMIAHRLGTLDVCDLRLEVDHGRVRMVELEPEKSRMPWPIGARRGTGSMWS